LWLQFQGFIIIDDFVVSQAALGDSPALSDAYQSLPKLNGFSFLTPLGLSPELASQMEFHHTGRILA
jgi:hypothetical protein